MAQGERELRERLARELVAKETVHASAYGVERLTRAERLGGLLGASIGSWIGGAFAIDSGWGLATTEARLLSVRVDRVQSLLRGPKLRFGPVQSHTNPSDLGVRVERGDRELVLHLTLEGRARALVFGDLPGFTGNLRLAVAIADWLAARH